MQRAGAALDMVSGRWGYKRGAPLHGSPGDTLLPHSLTGSASQADDCRWEVRMRSLRPGFAQKPFMLPHAAGTGPIVGLVIIVGILMLLAALSVD